MRTKNTAQRLTNFACVIFLSLQAQPSLSQTIPPVDDLINEIRNSSGHSSGHSTQSPVNTGVRSDAPTAPTHVREVWKVKASFALVAFGTGAGAGNVSKGFIDVLDSPQACTKDLGHGSSDFPQTLKGACPWGQLIRLRETGNTATEGKCFCTIQTNINAQDKVLMNENGVRVSEPGHGKTEPLPEPPPPSHVEERRKITAPFALASMKTIKNAGSVSRGFVELLKSPEACVADSGHGSAGFPQSKAGACPWGVLVRLKNTGNSKTEGKCFCTDPNNVKAQSKVLMDEDGVEVTQPGEGETTTEPVANLDTLFAALKNNSCKKHLDNRLGMPTQRDPSVRGRPDYAVRKRIKRCLDRIADKKDWMDSMCKCSTLRCAQMVKKSLYDAGLVGPEILQSSHANSSRIPKVLEDNGFVKCTGSAASNPRNAPQGAVLIYHSRKSPVSGDPGAPYGHIEIRSPWGYTSDFSISVPRTEYGKMVRQNGKMVRNRYLKHMYVKAPVKCP